MFDAAARHVVYVGQERPLIDAFDVGSIVSPANQVGAAAFAPAARVSTTATVVTATDSRRISVAPFMRMSRNAEAAIVPQPYRSMGLLRDDRRHVVDGAVRA
jgi:hypothetical protein